MSTPQTGIQRQHELDALRATAMLLGIALHAALSFAVGFPWIVRDHEATWSFTWIFWAIHGFRMPLFILISGYFTMMLWRRKGLASLIKQRTNRVLLPMLIGLVTILPSLIIAIIIAVTVSQAQDTAALKARAASTGMPELIREKKYEELKKKLEDGDNPNQVDGEFGIRALCWATMHQDMQAVRLLIDHSADVNAQDADGNRPLHRAASAGRADIVELLLKSGADPKRPGPFFQSPTALTKTNWNITKAEAEKFKVPAPESAEALESGRVACRALLAEHGDPQAEKAIDAAPSEAPSGWGLESMRARYQTFLKSPNFNVPLPWIGPVNIFDMEILIHLWFLWYLCWFVAFFALFVLLFSVVPVPRIPPALILSPLRWCWILPLTMLPQLFMGMNYETVGPDTSASILPKPHVLFYYAIFFFFGALSYDCNDQFGRLGKWWRIEMPIALFVFFPLAVFTFNRTWMPEFLAQRIPQGNETFERVIVSGVLQVFYVWLMSFGFIGLFRTFMHRETKAIRYLSDASYWFYLAHLTPMVLIQALVRTWPISPWIKFVIVCVSTCLILLVTYEYMVRYTWIGRLLNGPRQRPHATPESGSLPTVVAPP